MIRQQNLIFNGDWDIMIVLDACRFDMLNKELDCDVRKVKSNGSETLEWLKKTFTGRTFHVEYYSANPYVNNKNTHLPLTKSFDKIIEMHNKCWDEDKGTVYPEKFVGKYDNKSVLHFIQPHEPYLTEDLHSGLSPDRFKGKFNPIKKLIGNSLRKFFGCKRTTHLRTFVLGDKSRNRIEELVVERGTPYLLEKYRENLQIALESVKKIISINSDKKIVVTADHGEMLGEHNMYGHPSGSQEPILRNVPWVVFND